MNGFEAWVETARGNWFLTSQRYAPDVVYPDGMTHLRKFELRPWPTWRFELDDNLAIEQELFVPYGQSALGLTLEIGGDPGSKVKLIVRPLLSGRDFHATHHENNSFRFDPELHGDRVRWKPYQDIPAVVAQIERQLSSFAHLVSKFLLRGRASTWFGLLGRFGQSRTL